MARGGKREGAGRKTDAERAKLTQEKHNGDFDQQALAALPELFDTIRAIAQGYKIACYEKPRKAPGLDPKEMSDADGVPVWVYTVPPDKQAAFYLVDRAAGKAAAKERVQPDTHIAVICEIPRPAVAGGERDAAAEE